jgi:integrase
VFKKLGNFNPDHFKIEDARRAAKTLAADLANDVVIPSKSHGITVRAAFEKYVKALRARDPESKWADVVESYLESHFAGIADRRLASLSGANEEMIALHATITEEAGPSGANRAMQALRAVYKRERSLRPNTLPADNPVAVFGTLKVWHPERRAKKAVPFKRLPGWSAAVDEIAEVSPLRAAYHRLCMLTGARPGELARLKRKDVDWEARTFTLPKTKVRKMDIVIPMSKAIEAQLRIAFDEGDFIDDGTEWVFAADNSKSGHIKEPWEKTLPETGIHGRHTFKAVARAAGVHPDFVRALMGHVVPKDDAHSGYGGGEDDLEQDLRPAQEAISAKFRELWRRRAA